MYRKKVKAWIESGQGPTPSRLAAMDEAERFNLAMAALCVDAQLSVNKRGQVRMHRGSRGCGGVWQGLAG